jgi:hypothetical protein
VSEQDSTIKSEDEDVEAHGKKRAKFASEEATEAESERDDDVELHGSSKSLRSKS